MKEEDKPTKSELFFVCFATGAGIDLILVIIFVLLDFQSLISFFFTRYIYLLVIILVIIIFWPIYKRKIKHSKYFPF